MRLQVERVVFGSRHLVPTDATTRRAAFGRFSKSCRPGIAESASRLYQKKNLRSTASVKWTSLLFRISYSHGRRTGFGKVRPKLKWHSSALSECGSNRPLHLTEPLQGQDQTL